MIVHDDDAAEACDVSGGFLKPGRPQGLAGIRRIAQRKDDPSIEGHGFTSRNQLGDEAEPEKQKRRRQD